MREQSQPTLIDRRVREEWEQMGSLTSYERATREARRILETHVPDPLPQGAAEQLRGIIAETERELGVST